MLVQGHGQGRELVTPPLDGTILPGVTRDSILQLCKASGEFTVSERQLSINEIKQVLHMPSNDCAKYMTVHFASRTGLPPLCRLPVTAAVEQQTCTWLNQQHLPQHAESQSQQRTGTTEL